MGRVHNLMTRRRFYAPPGAIDAKANTATLSGDEARHLRDVLRLAQGDEVFLFDGEGREYRCSINKIGRASSTLRVIEEVTAAALESPLKLTIAVALLKGDKFDLVVQKATELGVTRIIPVKTARADIRLRDSADADKRVARWQRIALEAAKQCGRALVPGVAAPTEFSKLVSDPELVAGKRFMFCERGGEPLPESYGDQPKPDSMIALVGSEGGWTDEEVNGARETGWQIVTLGGRILRAETAAIAVSALLQHRFGDLR
ncbi:MAG: rRNA (uracil1498-N3)-methyltransferase [Blastocatellia bacterium]|jgi:16S rRNA (uracil1498-N3)-methyltransferase|nr:rRNA (uracil1498-N3)-methyltransferase [Blastocatellia bacterium]